VESYFSPPTQSRLTWDFTRLVQNNHIVEKENVTRLCSAGVPASRLNSHLILFKSDVIHQSVYELVHSEDREELQRQLTWSSFLSPEEQSASPPLTLQDLLLPENSHLLERSFTVRFRCLLDNTSGFLVSYILAIE
jgi:hypothetical protein